LEAADAMLPGGSLQATAQVPGAGDSTIALPTVVPGHDGTPPHRSLTTIAPVHGAMVLVATLMDTDDAMAASNVRNRISCSCLTAEYQLLLNE
jgi:hypothetical protein